ncbi:hypothetical protein D3C73_648770 [compost metagenome]
MGGRHRHAEVGSHGQHGGRAGFRSETVDRMQLDHLVAQGLDDLPAARGGTGGHHHRAGQHDPHGDAITGVRVRMHEGQPRRQVVQRAGRFGTDQGHRDDAHGLLRIVVAVGEAHVGRRGDLRLAEERIDDARACQSADRAADLGQAGNQRPQQHHHHDAEQEAGNRRGDHRHEHLPQQALVLRPAAEAFRPDQRIPVVVGRGEAGTTQAADQCVRGRGWQALPPRDQVPDDAAQQRAQDHLRGHIDHVGVEQARRDGQGYSGAGQCAQQVHERGEHHRPTGREHLGRHHGGDGVGGVVEAVDELENERGQDHHQDEGQHAVASVSCSSTRSGTPPRRLRGSGRWPSPGSRRIPSAGTSAGCPGDRSRCRGTARASGGRPRFPANAGAR